MLHTQEELLHIINKTITKEQFDYKPVELFEPIKYTLSLGGKHIRPLMLLMACEMFGGDINDGIYPAFGLEVFHNFTLIHDDILDNASLRRGKATVYKKWDLNRAILSGDTMFALSYDYFFRTKEEFIVPILKVFNKTAVEVCRGQQYDMNYETEKDVSIAAYIEMIRLKTAVLLGAAVKIGAIIGGAKEQDSIHIYNFAENLGIAFQLKDDILDLYSQQEVFGKETGGDIVSRKKTYLFLKACELADNELREQLVPLYLETSLEPQTKIKCVRAIFDKLKIKKVTEEEIDKYYKTALYHLDKITINKEDKASFYQFAKQLMKRDK